MRGKSFALAAIKGVLTGLLFFAAVFIVRLGYFLPIVLPLGAAVAAVATRAEQRLSGRRAAVMGVAVLAYALVMALLFWTLTNQTSRATLRMNWHVGPETRDGDAEVVFEFVDFPGN